VATVINKNERPGEGVYIGRLRDIDPLVHPSKSWGNPFKISRDGTREQVIERYRVWLWAQIKAGTISVASLAELDDKLLACFCAPKPCHGDVLVKAAAWAKRELAGQPNADGNTLDGFNTVEEFVAAQWPSAAKA
jgi:hypothetical protein